MEAVIIVFAPDTALTVNTPLVCASLMCKDESTVAIAVFSLVKSISSPPAGAGCEICSSTSRASPASMIIEAGRVTSGKVAADRDSVPGALIFPEISTALASRSMVSPPTRDPGT